MAGVYHPLPPVLTFQVEGTWCGHPGGGVYDTAAQGQVPFIVTQGDLFLRHGEWVTHSLMQLSQARAHPLST